MHLLLERWKSPVAPLLLVTDDAGVLRGLDFADKDSRMLRLLRLHYGNFTLEDGPAPKSITAALTQYFEGDMTALAEIPIATGGTAFQRDVWTALRAIPSGSTKTYGQLADDIGRSGASRAVGAANGSNPIAIIVPCHRVIGANGTLTGFAGGLDRKRWLLDHETKHSKVQGMLV